MERIQFSRSHFSNFPVGGWWFGDTLQDLIYPARWERCCVDHSCILPPPPWRYQALNQFQCWNYTGGPSGGPRRQSHPTQACREIDSQWMEMEKSLHIAHFSLSSIWTLYGISLNKDRGAWCTEVCQTGLNDWTTHGQCPYFLYSLWNLYSWVRSFFSWPQGFGSWNFYSNHLYTND